MGFAGICVEPAYDVDWNYDADASAELYLSGSGTLQATGGNGDAADGKFGGGAGIGGNGQDLDGGDSVDFGLVCVMESFAGVLYATGGESGSNRDAGRSFGGGAGIGSGGFNMNEYSWNEVFGSIEIHGGTVEARSIGNGAGIGAGGGQGDLDTALSEISIRITGGTITATGGKLGAGIGGGSICDGGRIFISGGKVNAIGGANDGSMGAAGIGGGNDASVWEVSITGGTVHATGSGGAAGIGGGTNTSYSNVHYGDEDGKLSPDKQGKITISGKETVVTAQGGTGVGGSGSIYGGAGIGSGYPTGNNGRSVAYAISITDGASVRALGGFHAQAIGYGFRPKDFTGYGITLTLDGTIFLWAQNADYYQPALVAATQYNGNPISYSSDENYLVWYTDEDREAQSASSSAAVGFLHVPQDKEDGTFSWSYDAASSAVSIGDIAYVDQVTGLNGNWATLGTQESITIAPADIIIYVGGEGYESVVVDAAGGAVGAASEGLPEPGFVIELPAEIDKALKEAAQAPLDQPLDLSPYLSFSYDDEKETVRSWMLERYDNKPGNDSMAYGRYIYRIVPAAWQEKIRLEFTDEDGKKSNSDEFVIRLEDLYRIYNMTIYAGALHPDYFRAKVEFPGGGVRALKLESGEAELFIRGVTDAGDPTTTILTQPPVVPVSNMTAQVPAGTLFYINESQLEVANWNAVRLLADHIVPAAQEPLHQSALEEFQQITPEYQALFRYLDLVDTSNGNVWVTADKPVEVYWPYPAGTSAQTQFYLVHYSGLDRDDDDALGDGNYKMTLYSAEEGTLENTAYGIRFSVESFSPFALFWKGEGGVGGDGNDEGEILYFDETDPGMYSLPQTEDASHPTGWILLALLSLACLFVLGRMERVVKQNRRQ